MSKRLGLREKARADQRKSGSKRTFMNWLNGLDPEVRAEVVELLDDTTIDGAAAYRTLKAEVGCPFTDAVVGKWRNGDYEPA